MNTKPRRRRRSGKGEGREFSCGPPYLVSVESKELW